MPCPPRSDPDTRAVVVRDDRGAVTVEAAIAVGAIVLVTAAVIAAVATVLASVRCVDAARELARAASRGETDRGRAAAARIAPTGAGMDVRIDGETVVVVVTSASIGALPVEVSGTATGLLEPGVVREVTPPVPDSDPAEVGVGVGVEPHAQVEPHGQTGPGFPAGPAEQIAGGLPSRPVPPSGAAG